MTSDRDPSSGVDPPLPPTEETPTTPESADPGPPPAVPRQIGPYLIVRQLGRGGVGHVYLAEQERPVRRKVALKLILAGAASENILRRFESERQAMARLNHPNIAQIFDAGTGETGIPYIAMEYVDGHPLTQWARNHAADLGTRIELFLRVCDGVQHAHQKGILHRDIKPSNVLVTELDGQSTPKIIDFGLAKAVGFALTDDPLHTRADVAVGTPAYMAPEQLTGDAGGADTRSDVYALGVLLYQLLTGEPPFDPTSLSQSSYREMVRVLEEETPERPSRRFARLRREDPETVPSDADAVARALGRDLDWVVLKALEKDPERRYRSPRKLADDLQRFLNNEPVEAHQPTVGYRVAKYLRRHAWLVTGTSTAVLALALTFAWGLQRSRAEAARANREAATAEQVSEFLVDLFQVSDPGEAQGESVTARELLERGAERIETELAGEPLVQARLMDTMGTVYIQLGLYDRAEEMMRRAVQIQEAEGESLDLALALESLAWVHFQQGRYRATLAPLERSLAIRERFLDPGDSLIGESLNNLAALNRELANYDRAEELYRRSIANLEQQPDSEESLAYPVANLATVLHDQERYEEAEPLHLRALALRRRVHGEQHPDVALSYNDVGWFYYLTGDYDRAEEFHLQALELERELYDPEHPTIALSLNNLGLVDLARSNLDRAEERFNEALAMRRKRLQPGHHNIAQSLRGLGQVAAARGEVNEARRLLERALEIFVQARGTEHRETTETKELLASLNEVQAE